MQRLVWCSSQVDVNTSLRCFTDCIGCVHRSESRTSMPCWCTSVSVDSRRPTWLTICSQSLNFQVDDACGHHRPRHWLYHGHAFEPSVTARFPLQQQGHGTVCRRKWQSSLTLSSFEFKLKTYLFKLTLSETRFYTRVQQLDLRFGVKLGVKLWCYGNIKWPTALMVTCVRRLTAQPYRGSCSRTISYALLVQMQ